MGENFSHRQARLRPTGISVPNRLHGIDCQLSRGMELRWLRWLYHGMAQTVRHTEKAFTGISTIGGGGSSGRYPK